MVNDKLKKEYDELIEKQRNKNLEKNFEIINYTMGLSGEANEVLEMIKKWQFQGHPLNIKKLELEMGDVLFYYCSLAKMFDLDIENIMLKNIEKIKNRYPEGFKEKDSINRIENK